MKKTMTAKEFKAVLENAGITLDVYGYEGILNLVSMALESQADNMKNNGLNAGAKGYRDSAISIFLELDKRGFYKS